jgi:hypothetical protein
VKFSDLGRHVEEARIDTMESILKRVLGDVFDEKSSFKFLRITSKAS